jgi:hypothetical protein
MAPDYEHWSKRPIFREGMEGWCQQQATQQSPKVVYEEKTGSFTEL